MGLVVFIDFRKNLNVDLLCKTYNYWPMPTARNQFGRKVSEWALQEDNDPKHMSKLANEWRLKHEIHRTRWPSMSSDLRPPPSKIDLRPETFKWAEMRRLWQDFRLDLLTFNRDMHQTRIKNSSFWYKDFSIQAQ